MKPFLTFLLLTVLPLGMLHAVELRIDNEIQIGGQSEAVKSTVFLLNDDFISIIGENGEITVFDAKTQIFTLLDPALHLQTQIDAAETKKCIEYKRQQVITQKEIDKKSFLFFVMQPHFSSAEYDAASGNLALQSPWMDYDVKTAPLGSKETAKAYFDFCDWMCYLNLRLNPGSSSMLVRKEVDRLLQEKNRFAAAVSVSIYPKGKGILAKSRTAHSSSILVNRLDENDKKRIEQVWNYKRSFPQVPFTEYQQKVGENLKK
jgi:hypothetical protein